MGYTYQDVVELRKAVVEEIIRETNDRMGEGYLGADHVSGVLVEERVRTYMAADVKAHEMKQEASRDPVCYLIMHPKEGRDVQFAPLTEADRKKGYHDVPLYAL